MSSVSEENVTKSERIEHLEKMNDILLNAVKGRKGPEDVLKDALDSENVDVLRFLIESEILDVNTKVEQEVLGAYELGMYYADEVIAGKISPLSYAILTKSLKLVKFLLSVNGLDVNISDPYVSPLMYAIHFSSPEIVTSLLEHNAIKFEPENQICALMTYFPDILNHRIASGEDPENVLRILQLLIQHPSTSAANMCSGLFDLVMCLDHTDTPKLFYAYAIRALKMLLADPRTNVNYHNIDHRSRTALHETPTVDIARLLVEAGADIFVQNSDNETPR
eukprot:939239_1